MIQPAQQNNTSLNLTQPIQEATVPSRFNQLSVNNVKSETSTFIGQGPSDKAATNATTLQIANDLSPCLTGYDLELQGMLDTIFYNFCKKKENQESRANQLNSILKEISYKKVFLWLSTSKIAIEHTPLEKSILADKSPLMLASAYGNLPMLKVVLKYLTSKSIFHKAQRYFANKDYSIDESIKASFDLAIKAGNVNIVKYIYTTFNNIISPSYSIFLAHIEQALEIVNHIDVFKFLYETAIANALNQDDSKIYIDAINLCYVKKAAEKAEERGNQELLAYIKTLNIDFSM